MPLILRPVSETYDIIVVGLGAMGSATACHLAARGRRVLGLDRFAPPHALGSSHGQTRIIREAYFEHPAYVPLVQRAYSLWAELEKETGRALFRPTGGLMIGPPEGEVVRGAQRSAELHRLAHQRLSAAEVRKSFPALQPSDDMAAIWEPRAGILFPEQCVAAHLELARRRGATLRDDELVTHWTATGSTVRVVTASGEYCAAKLILTAGAWIDTLMPEWKKFFAVERQVQFWFTPRSTPELFAPERCPIHLWEHAPGRYFYGFPDLGDGVKLAGHHEGELAPPDAVRRDVSEGEVDAMRAIAARFVPGANGPLRGTAVCRYTNTPDSHFLIDEHPAHPGVLIASPCSGHGFKFSSAIGEVLADWAEGVPSRFDLSLFRRRGAIA